MPILACITHVYGQSTEPDEVCTGTTKTYWVNETAGSVYSWSINGSILPDQSALIEITWDTPGNYLLSVEETNSGGCQGETRTLEINVVDNLPVSISLEASASNACEGSEVQFNATAVNAGSNPVYSWMVNGNVLPGENNPILTLTISENVLVQATVMSNLECVLNNPATSNVVEVVMSDDLFVDVDIYADQQFVCEGTEVTVTAVPVNGGSDPTFTWYLNGQEVSGETGPTFTFNPENNDVVHVSLFSHDDCTVNNPATSISLAFEVQAIPSILASGNDPAYCNQPGFISFVFENVPDGVYDIIYSTGVFEDVAVNGGSASVQALPGLYENLTLSVNNCISVDDPDVLINSLEGPLIGEIYKYEPSCYLDNGQISINASGEGKLRFSINSGTDWQDEPVFSSLQEGNYFVFVQDALECITEYADNPVILTNTGGAEIAEVGIMHPVCGNNSGQISINASGEGKLRFSINSGTDWQDEPVFNNLQEGNYFVFVQDNAGCVAEYVQNPVVLQQEPAPQLIGVIKKDAVCGFMNGRVEILAQGGTGPTQFSIDGGLTWQATPIFNQLMTGNYYITIRDQNQCLVAWPNNPLFIENKEAVSIVEVISGDASCHQDDGSIEIITNNIPFKRFFSIDNGYTWQDSGIFSGLPVGFYTIWVSDENQCDSEYDANPVEIKRKCSDLFVLPNAFSPNGDGVNDYFGPVWAGNKPVEYSMFIFNSWGEMLFVTDNPYMPWDGSYKGAIVPAGTYVYKVVLRFISNRATDIAAEEFHGTVQAIR